MESGSRMQAFERIGPGRRVIVLWLVGAAVVALAAWLGPGLVAPNFDEGSTSAANHYGLGQAWRVLQRQGIAPPSDRRLRVPQ